MLIDIKARIGEAEIKEIIQYSVFPDPESLEKTLNEYKVNRNLKLFAYEEGDGIIGIIGIELVGKQVKINHIAVQPNYRGMGYGRGLILELILKNNPKEIVAETDEEAVEFYRSVGFAISSLGEKYPGRERFNCVYRVDEA